MTREAFERLVAEAVTLIPARFRAEMQNLALVVEDQPAADLLGEMGIEPPDTLYGLYQGTPLTERHWSQGNNLPDRITIYQRPIEEDRRRRGRARHDRGNADPRSRPLLRLKRGGD